MNMNCPILSALKEQFENWDQLLGSMSEEQITVRQFDLGWSIKSGSMIYQYPNQPLNQRSLQRKCL